MLKILKFLKSSFGEILLIFLLLVVQAFCDLSLPDYTSNIVNVGIQQNGVDSVVPKYIRESEFEKIRLFLSSDDANKVSDFYDVNDGVMTLKDGVTEDSLLTIENIIKNPTMMVFVLENADEPNENAPAMDMGELNAMMGNLPEGASLFDVFPQIPEENRLQMIDEMSEKLSAVGDVMVDQMVIQYVIAEYESVGIDMDELQMDYIYNTGAKMLTLSLVMMAAAILVGFFASKTAALFGLNLRNVLFSKVLSFSNEEMEKYSTASLITRSTNDIQQLQFIIVMMLRMILYAPIIGIGGVIKVMNTDTGMSWIIVVAVVTVLLLIGILMLIALPKFSIMQTLIDKLNSVTREILTGLPVIRAFSREKYEEKRFNTANLNLMKVQLFTNRVMTFMFPAMMFVMNGVAVLIVWNGGKGIDSGIMQVGDMIAFINYTMMIVMSFLMLAMISIILPRAVVSAKRINEVLETEITIKDKDVVNDKISDGKIEFKNVSFRYHDADGDVLENISFTANSGETTAIIGSTGSGKSTLINLIPRFFDVTSGEILIDGVDIRDMSQKYLRNAIGLVPQKGILFSGTISSNIKFADEGISDENMQLAAKIAQAEEFISEKDNSYDEAVSQGGTNVSGGQKQRLAIARAIAKQPKIYIFDDSFSALDYKTDRNLRKALSENITNSSIIIVAQRISTIISAEKIIVLDDGKVAGVGTHDELMKNSEVYRQIAYSQLSEKELGIKADKEGE